MLMKADISYWIDRRSLHGQTIFRHTVVGHTGQHLLTKKTEDSWNENQQLLDRHTHSYWMDRQFLDIQLLDIQGSWNENRQLLDRQIESCWIDRQTAIEWTDSCWKYRPTLIDQKDWKFLIRKHAVIRQTDRQTNSY